MADLRERRITFNGINLGEELMSRVAVLSEETKRVVHSYVEGLEPVTMRIEGVWDMSEIVRLVRAAIAYHNWRLHCYYWQIVAKRFAGREKDRLSRFELNCEKRLEALEREMAR